MVQSQAISQIFGVCILDTEGERLAVRYAAPSQELFPDFLKQRAFEKKIIAKIPQQSQSKDKDGKDTHADIAIIDDLLVLFRVANDVVVIVISELEENELVLVELLDGIFDSLITCCCGSIMSQGLSKREVLVKLERAILILDEVQDDGIILETEEEKIVHRVKMHGSSGQEPLGSSGSQTQDTVAQVAEKTKKNFLKSIFPGRG